VGIALREQKATRTVPLVFIEGDPEKTARVRGLLPDAVFTTWLRIGAALRRALRDAAAPKDTPPVVPGTFAGYAGTPLPRKLRIREGSVVALVHAPEGFEAKLAPLPEGARVERRLGNADVTLAFVKSVAALGRELPGLAREMQAGRTLWLIWPKRTSALAGDLGEPKVREMASQLVWWITKCAPWMRPGVDWPLPCAAPPGKNGWLRRIAAPVMCAALFTVAGAV